MKMNVMPHHVTQMPPVQTVMAVIHVYVMQDTLEMDTHAMVKSLLLLLSTENQSLIFDSQRN